eukprot:11260818-Alexandrium_andersonii.AAC.1
MDTGSHHPPASLPRREPRLRPPDGPAGQPGALPQTLGGMGPRMGGLAAGPQASGTRWASHG